MLTCTILILTYRTLRAAQRLTLTGVWAGVDSAWEQEKPEARKMLLNRAREASHTSGARGVSPLFCFKGTLILIKVYCQLYSVE